MALQHASPGQLIDLQALAEFNPEGQSTSLIKAEQLQLLHLLLPSGQRLHEHKLAGELCIHCLAGRVRLEMPGTHLPLSAGQMTLLAAGQAHAVVAEMDSSLLVTVVLKG
jgi:quercetin dioxygenase-like cupin family protein